MLKAMTRLDQADKFLLDQIRTGNGDAWTQLLDRYQGRLLTFARGKLGSAADADDIVQDTFIYHDDVQVSWLIHMMGYQIYCVPDSIVYHHYALHMFPEKLFWLERNRWEMLAYSLELRSLLLYLPLLALTELLIIGYSFVKGPRYVAAKLRAYAAIWRRRRALRQKRAVVQTLRALPDSEFVPRFKKGYAWRQLSTIARRTRRVQPWVRGSGL